MQRAVIGENGCIASLWTTDEDALAEYAYVRGEHRRMYGKCRCRVDDVDDDACVGDEVQLQLQLWAAAGGGGAERNTTRKPAKRSTKR